MWTTKHGVNANTESDINHFGASGNNRENAREYLSKKYGRDFSQAEADALANRADKAHTSSLGGVGHTVASTTPYSSMLSAKIADGYRENGVWTKAGGLHTGYGFGLKGSMKTGVKDELKSLAFDTHRVGKEGIMNSLGMLTNQQKMAMEASGKLGKVMVASNPLASMAMVGAGMYNLEDPGQIMTEQLSQAAGFTGFVAGSRMGGAISNMISNKPPSTVAGYIGKGGARLLGGGLVGIAGYAAVQGVSAGIRDITSAESKIGSTAYKMASREYYGDTSQNRATLTARQRALQQVNSSVFNDRGFTLGNEASILANTSL